MSAQSPLEALEGAGEHLQALVALASEALLRARAAQQVAGEVWLALVPGEQLELLRDAVDEAEGVAYETAVVGAGEEQHQALLELARRLHEELARRGAP